MTLPSEVLDALHAHMLNGGDMEDRDAVISQVGMHTIAGLWLHESTEHNTWADVIEEARHVEEVPAKKHKKKKLDEPTE